jgi:hypothetical protein
MPEALLVLVKTFLENGYRVEELDTSSVSILLINRCWKENIILKISRSDIAREKINLSEQWHELLHSPMYSGIKIAKLEESERMVAVDRPVRIVKEERPLELDPSDRLVMDTSDVVDSELDLDFLKELGSNE